MGIEQIENKSLRPRLAAGYRMASKFDARMMSMAWKSARNAEIEKIHSEGASYAALARQFELSPSRVHTIIANTKRLRQRLQDRKSVVTGKRVARRDDHGGRVNNKKKKNQK